MGTYGFCYWFIIKILFKMKYELSLELAVGTNVLHCHHSLLSLWHHKGQIHPRRR